MKPVKYNMVLVYYSHMHQNTVKNVVLTSPWLGKWEIIDEINKPFKMEWKLAGAYMLLHLPKIAPG